MKKWEMPHVRSDFYTDQAIIRVGCHWLATGDPDFEREGSVQPNLVNKMRLTAADIVLAPTHRAAMVRLNSCRR